ncbi:glycosyltransferase family 4 protein [Flavobacterium sp.]|jgi:glycosyltransferase involved in cell wall biosynthesis|uniref:glycosyltransferase family 4 protein n=1 Tax=Flavobacterium sp. TaxID=239 RepID=UPI0037C0F9C5
MRANIFPVYNSSLVVYKEAIGNLNGINFFKMPKVETTTLVQLKNKELPEILFITTYPPRECGIATYTQDLRNAIQEKFGNSFALKVCALNAKESDYKYSDEVKYTIQTDDEEQFVQIANCINADKNIAMIFLQHEFGLFGGENGDYLLKLMAHLKRPITTTFHTVLPNPNPTLKKVVRRIVDCSDSVIVMTNISAALLKNDYGISNHKIAVIAHGTHLVTSNETAPNKSKIHLADRIVLSTFGLLSEGKSIETAIEAMPKIIERFPDVIYLVIGKTHPEVLKRDGEKYRNSLYEKVHELGLQNNVRFINRYLSLPELMDYLQRTKIYLFTSKDPNQAVSGTLAYALACGCPVISTPIPHAKELLDGAGINFDFQNPKQLAEATIKLLFDPKLLKEMRLNALHAISSTSWQNAAIAHIELTKSSLAKRKVELKYELPKISLDHIKRLTTSDGMIQFSQIASPDLDSGYTLDDNARALIAVSKHYELTGDVADLELITTYLDFIIFCQQEDGTFLNYVDRDGNFFLKNQDENLEDSNGRAIWALGEFCSYQHLFSEKLLNVATIAFEKAFMKSTDFLSPRAIAFSIKGLYFYNLDKDTKISKVIITQLADNLVSKFRGVSDKNWKWFENYLTYANSLLPEAMLYASMSTGSLLYRKIAVTSFNFLLSIIFRDNQIKVISNQGWHHKNKSANDFGEQPIDVTYTILALNTFYKSFKDEDYLEKMETAFNWFLGKNHLHQIVYNPATGGCYDGLEETHVNLNQGAESTVSYLMARLVFEEIQNPKFTTKLTDSILEAN